MSGHKPPNTTRLAEMLRLYMSVNKLEVRPMARQIGVSPATVSRMAQGKELTGTNLIKLINWMLRYPRADKEPS